MTKGNLIIPRRNSTTGCSFMSYPGQIIIIIIIIIILSPSIITGSSFRPDLILLTNDNILYILELTIGFETNIKINSDRKASKYYPLRQTLLSKYNQVSFINLSLGAVGTIGASSESFINLLKSLGFNNNSQKHILSQLINITIRCTYFIFCCRNKSWTKPDLLEI